MSVGPDDPPRRIVPTPATVTVLNAGGARVGRAVGAAVGIGVGVLVHAMSTRAVMIKSRFTGSLSAHPLERPRRRWQLPGAYVVVRPVSTSRTRSVM